MKTLRLWRGDVNRWHSYPCRKLRNSGDSVHAHAARCQILLIDLHPNPSADLLMACLLHDAAETMVGDTPYGAKLRWPMLKSALDWAETEAEAQLGIPTPATETERDWIKLVDRLDAWMWMREVSPELEQTGEWQSALSAMLALADGLNVRERVYALAQGVDA